MAGCGGVRGTTTGTANATAALARLLLPCPARARLVPAAGRLRAAAIKRALLCFLPALAALGCTSVCCPYVEGWYAVARSGNASSLGTTTRSEVREGEADESEEGEDVLGDAKADVAEEGDECTAAGHSLSSKRPETPFGVGRDECGSHRFSELDCHSDTRQSMRRVRGAPTSQCVDG